jgi:FG-GAP repeat
MRRLVITALACSVLGSGQVRRASAQAEGEEADRATPCHHESWVEAQTLDTDEPTARQALAVHGDTLVTGGDGVVRVYHRSGGTSWTLTQTLTPAPGAPSSAFGRGLALDGHTLIIGAGLENASATAFPFGYSDVYRRQGGQWTFEARLQPNPGTSPACQESSFGKNIAVDGDLAVITAHRMGLGPGGCGQGAAFVFQRASNSWSQVQILPAPQIPISNPPTGYPNFDTNFGDSMSSFGDELVIGQPGRGQTPRLQGALHVFVRTGSSYALQQAFVAPGTAYNAGDGLGVEVAIRGRTLTAAKNGSLQSFLRHGGNWTAASEIAATTPPFGAHALARSDDDLLLSATGSVQVFNVHHDGQLAADAALTVADVQNNSATAADRDTFAVAGSLGVHVFQRQ